MDPNTPYLSLALGIWRKILTKTRKWYICNATDIKRRKPRLQKKENEGCKKPKNVCTTRSRNARSGSSSRSGIRPKLRPKGRFPNPKANWTFQGWPEGGRAAPEPSNKRSHMYPKQRLGSSWPKPRLVSSQRPSTKLLGIVSHVDFYFSWPRKPQSMLLWVDVEWFVGPDAFIIFFLFCLLGTINPIWKVASVNHSRLTWRLLMPRTNDQTHDCSKVLSRCQGLDGCWWLYWCGWWDLTTEYWRYLVLKDKIRLLQVRS